MSTILRWLRRIPFFEALRAFLEQWGLWKVVVSLGSFALWVAVTAWAFLSDLPGPYVVTMAIVLLAGLVAIIKLVPDTWLRVRAVNTPVPKQIDRESLAEQAEQLSAAIAALSSEYEAKKRLAWHKESERMMSSRSNKRTTSRDEGIELEAKVIERYGDKYKADVWRVLVMAAYCGVVQEKDLWRFRHGMSSAHDLDGVHQILTKVAVELRYPQLSLPMESATNPPASSKLLPWL